VFTNWDDRPAVLLSWGKAVAVLEPGGDWVEVDAGDVANTAGVMSPEAAEARFGPLPPLPSPDSVPATARHSPVDAGS
jgi:hypothetical protein